MNRQMTLAMLVAVLALGGVSWAADNPKNLSPQETVFLRQQAQNDLLMQRLGDYATNNAATVQVRDLGKKIAADHRVDLKNLQNFGKDHNLSLPEHDDLTLEQKGVYDRLTTKHGLDFDRAYTKWLAQQYATTIKQYERERDRAEDIVVRDYARNALSDLQKHQQEARDAEKAVWGA